MREFICELLKNINGIQEREYIVHDNLVLNIFIS